MKTKHLTHTLLFLVAKIQLTISIISCHSTACAQKANTIAPIQVTVGRHLFPTDSTASTLPQQLQFKEVDKLPQPEPEQEDDDTTTYYLAKNLIEDETKLFYDSMKARADRSFWARGLYGWMLTNPTEQKNQFNTRSNQYFLPFAGKTIASIRFQQLDVFGPSLEDTTIILTSWVAKYGNSIHQNTKINVLKKQLYFSVGQKIDPIQMAENEKIIRDLPHIKDVAILCTTRAEDPQLVDLVIITKDKFAWGGTFSASSKTFKAGFNNRNVLGYGHELSGKMVYHLSEKPTVGGEFLYAKRNIWGKFIDATLGYSNTYQSQGALLELNKEFLTSKTIHAGGLSVALVDRHNRIGVFYPVELDTIIAYDDLDLWYGHAFAYKKSSQEFDNIVLAGRYLHRTYSKRPDVSQNSNRFFHNYNLFISSIGYSNRKLYRNNLVYGYGITEDIPYGTYIELTGGYEQGEYRNRLYSHLYLTKAMILNGGSYLKCSIGAGGFYTHGEVEQGIISFNANFFTSLFKYRRRSIRQFVNFEYTRGINRFQQEYLTFSPKNIIRGFNSRETTGPQRLSLSLETVGFIEKTFYGFRFAQYLFSDFGYIGDNSSSIFKQDFYSGIGMGIRIRNESLVFNTIDFRIAWYPNTPSDMHQISFDASGRAKSQFEDLLGRKPAPLPYY